MNNYSIKVDKACNPEHINWKNISRKNNCRSCCQGFCNFLVSIFLIIIILGVFWGKIYF